MADVVNSSARSVADKVMTLIRAIGAAAEPLRLATLAEVSGTSKATCRRLLLDLCTQGYVRSPARGLYMAGPRLHGLAAAVVRNDPLAGVIAESLGALARATGHVAARVSVADGRAVVLSLENPQHQPLPLSVGGELPPHALWTEGGVRVDRPMEEYPTSSTWMMAAPIDDTGTNYMLLTGFSFLRPQGGQAEELLNSHASTLSEAMTGMRHAG